MIYLLEDDDSIRKLVIYALQSQGYEAAGFERPSEFWHAMGRRLPELVLLDVMLPEEDGLSVLKKLRSATATAAIPVIMLTAKNTEFDRVTGLDCGADDFVSKPFGMMELLARVRTAIRHTRTTSANSEIAREGTYTVGEMTIDYNKHQVLVRGENVHLTLSEFRIVALLGKFAGKVLTYDYIIKELWGPRAGGDNQILRVNMANIRRKIEKNPAEPEYLFTEVGVGYRMAENTDN